MWFQTWTITSFPSSVALNICMNLWPSSLVITSVCMAEVAWFWAVEWYGSLVLATLVVWSRASTWSWAQSCHYFSPLTSSSWANPAAPMYGLLLFPSVFQVVLPVLSATFLPSAFGPVLSCHTSNWVSPLWAGVAHWEFLTSLKCGALGAPRVYAIEWSCSGWTSGLSGASRACPGKPGVTEVALTAAVELASGASWGLAASFHWVYWGGPAGLSPTWTSDIYGILALAWFVCQLSWSVISPAHGCHSFSPRGPCSWASVWRNLKVSRVLVFILIYCPCTSKVGIPSMNLDFLLMLMVWVNPTRVASTNFILLTLIIKN